MEQVFFDRYKVCRDPEGKPEEAGRIGAAITYKAIDKQSKEAVVLQLVPLAAIDQARREEFEARAKTVQAVEHINVARVMAAGVQHGYFVFVTEYLEGETADTWIVARGTMTPDAVLRIGMQVVRATGAAAFHGLTHRAIQPSNIIILRGESPSGGWPFVKLMNLGVAALELHGESGEARELAPSMVPPFASPEQVLHQQIDFRSEMYSLGATMCFLLTGAVPLPSVDEAYATRRGPRRLPQVRSRPLRQLLGTMLAENPEHRPFDPVALERYMVSILGLLERRHAIARKLGIPLAANVHRKAVRSRSPIAQVARGGLVFAALLIALAAIAAIIYPKFSHRDRSADEIGVPVGVPVAEVTNSAPPPAQSSFPADNLSPTPSAPVVQNLPAGSVAALAKNTQPVNPAAPAVGTPPSTSTFANVTSSESAASQENVSQVSPGVVAASSAATPPSVARNDTPDNSEIVPKATNRETPSGPRVVDAKARLAKDGDSEPEAPGIGPDEGDTARIRKNSPKTQSKLADNDAAESADNEPEPPGGDAPDDVDAAPILKHSDRAQPNVTMRSNPAARNRELPERTPVYKRSRWPHAIFIGTTPRGRLLFRLPSGRIVAMTPRNRRSTNAVRPRPYPQGPPGYFAPPPYGY